MAHNELKKVDADVKYMMFLSDGQPYDKGYTEAVRAAAADGITVSTIALGFNGRVLERLAKEGGGRYYNVTNAMELPEIMLSETEQVTVDSKITGWRGEGQLRLRQVFSRFFEVVENAAQGRDVRVTITTALKDPDSMNGEEERYSVDNVALDSLPLVNYATGKVNEQVIPFRFLPGDLKQLSGITVTEVA